MFGVYDLGKGHINVNGHIRCTRESLEKRDPL